PSGCGLCSIMSMPRAVAAVGNVDFAGAAGGKQAALPSRRMSPTSARGRHPWTPTTEPDGPMQPRPVDDTTLARLFTAARTHRVWLDHPVGDALLRRVYDLAKYGAT